MDFSPFSGNTRVSDFLKSAYTRVDGQIVAIALFVFPPEIAMPTVCPPYLDKGRKRYPLCRFFAKAIRPPACHAPYPTAFITALPTVAPQSTSRSAVQARAPTRTRSAAPSAKKTVQAWSDTFFPLNV